MAGDLRWIHRLGWVPLALLGAGNASRLLPFQVDDAFITYRFSRNVLDGHGLVFNPEGPVVEGFSSPAWLLAQVVAGSVVGAEGLPLAAAALGLACLAAATALSWRVAGPELPGRVVAAALVSTLPGVAFYGASGLEPVAFLVVVLAVAGAVVGALPSGVGVCAALLAVAVRPEGLWLPVMLGVMQLVHRGPWRRAALLVASTGAGALVLLVWRWTTFGDVLPNTWYAKTPDRLAGLRYVADLVVTPWGGALLVVAVLGAWWGGRRHRAWLVAAFSWLVAAAIEGGDWMPLGRMLIPATGLLALAASGVASGPRWRLVPPLGAVVLFLLAFQAQREQSHLSYRSVRHDAVALADWLERQPVDVVAMVDIGTVGFRTGVEIVDLAGLTDPVNARAPGGHLGKQIDPAYVLGERGTDAVVLRLEGVVPPDASGGIRLSPTQASSQMEGLLLDDQTLGRDYRLVRLFAPAYARNPQYALAVFLRRDLSLPEPLEGAERFVERPLYRGALHPLRIHDYGTGAER